MEHETKNELITEGSALIAEFMELKRSKGVQYDSRVYYHIPYYHDSLIAAEDQFLYHISWDWLMPVWIKFRDLEYKEGMLHHSHWRSIISNQLYIAKHPSELLPSLVNAIKWYINLER